MKYRLNIIFYNKTVNVQLPKLKPFKLYLHSMLFTSFKPYIKYLGPNSTVLGPSNFKCTIEILDRLHSDLVYG